MHFCKNCEIETKDLDSNRLCYDCQKIFYNFLKNDFKPLCDCINTLAKTKNGDEYTDNTKLGAELLLKINDMPKFIHGYFEKHLKMSVDECLELFEKNIDFINSTENVIELTEKLNSREAKKETNTNYIC